MRPAAAMISGGKDSVYAFLLSFLQGFEVRALVSVLPREEYLFHAPDLSVLEKISQITGRPLLLERGDGEEALYRLLRKVKEEYKVKWIVSGAVGSEYQRFVFNKVCSELGLKLHTPLWGIEGKKYLKMLAGDGIRFKIVKTGVYGIEEVVGKEINEKNLKELIYLSEKIGFDPSGEGGEYESEVVPETLILFFE